MAVINHSKIHQDFVNRMESRSGPGALADSLHRTSRVSLLPEQNGGFENPFELLQFGIDVGRRETAALVGGD